MLIIKMFKVQLQECEELTLEPGIIQYTDHSDQIKISVLRNQD